jgi:hypothetical protein
MAAASPFRAPRIDSMRTAAVDGQPAAPGRASVPAYPATVVDRQRETATGSVNCHTRAGMPSISSPTTAANVLWAVVDAPDASRPAVKLSRAGSVPMQGRGTEASVYPYTGRPQDDRRLARRRADSEFGPSVRRSTTANEGGTRVLLRRRVVKPP